MAKKTTTKKAADRSDGGRAGFLRELIALGLIAVATLLALSLASYDPYDDTLLFSNPDSQGTRNYIGAFGANVAAMLVQLFGYASFMLPALAFIWGGCLALRVSIPAAVTKIIGVIGLFLGTSVGLALLIPELSTGGMAHSFSGGGVFGGLLLDALRAPFSDLAIAIITVAVLAISLLLATHFSFGLFFRRIGEMLSSSAKGAAEKRSQAKQGTAAKKKPVVVVKVQLPWGGKKEEPKPAKRGLATAVNKELPFDEEPVEELEREPEEEFKPILVSPRRKTKRRASRPQNGLPPVTLLDEPPESDTPLNLKMLTDQARAIVNRYREFGVDGEVLQTNPGPVVNTFEFKPAAGVKYSKVIGLSDELCLALRAISVRINRLAGKSTIGIEVPNHNRELISFRDVVESPEFEHSKSPLSIALGKNINGDPHVTSLDQMPHLMIAGATGTGKSVALNAMICSLLYKSTADQVKLILIDPKKVELNYYDGIPHLLTPVVSSPKRAANALRWACEEMDIRYQRLAAEGCRNIEQFNRVAAETRQRYADLSDETGEQQEEAAIEPMPYIVIVIDELSDLMMVSSADVEESICRLAQKARAVGIHLIIATQRPSVDVLTGVIKANFQCRIAFRVATKVDSRTILDSNGAENLLGDGDMLFLPPRSSRLIRLHGPFISEKEVERTVEFLRELEEPDYDEDILTDEGGETGRLEDLAPERDPLYNDAVGLVLATGVASISNLQRKMRLGYARAARIIDTMEAEGIVGPADGSKPREILKKQMN